MDQKVLMTQVWLNNTYSGRTGYIDCDEDGATGNGTIASLISALQIEIGVSPVTGEFGPLTASMCPTLKLGSAGNKVNILQGALWCKGYSSSDLTKTYDGATISGVNAFKKAAGLPQNGEVDPKTFKGILSTDAVVWGSMGDPRIQEIQRGLNSKYSDYFWKDLNICPVDGAYGRNTCNALLYAFQKEVGIDEPNGVFGPGTAQGANDHNVALNSKQTALVYLLQYMLYVNGFNPGSFDGVFDITVENAVINFQSLMALDADGWVGLSTWAALLVSKGNVDRPCNAIDTTARISRQRASYLKSIGVNYCGRYINGYWRLSLVELNNIINSGMKFFPIFQRSGGDLVGLNNRDVTSAEYFSMRQGQSDAIYAVSQARHYGLPSGTTIYFAVDFDVYDYEVANNIIPYFEGVNLSIEEYNVGVYAPRYTCTTLMNRGLTVNCFVSDMSTGFSGNIGQKIPENWAFDQFYETEISSGFYVDKVIASGRDTAVSSYSVASVSKEMCRDVVNTFLPSILAPSGELEFGAVSTVMLGNIQVDYKSGTSVEWTPMLNPDTVNSNNKFTFTIEDGQVSPNEFSSSQDLFNGFPQSVTQSIGLDDDSLQPILSLANTINKGKITLAVTADGYGNMILDITVEQELTENSSVFTEVKFTFYKSDYPEQIDSIMNGLKTATVAAFAILLIVGLIAVFGSGLGEGVVAFFTFFGGLFV